MRSLLQSRLAAACLLPAVLAAAAGCTREIPIVQVPAFWTPQLKRIAVVPFRNRSTGKDAGNIVSDRLANALAANGTYKVFNRNDLKDLMDQNDLKIALGGDPAKAATAFKKLANVQAILTGAVTTYAATSQSQRKQEPQYYYVKGVQRFGGYRVYTHTRNEANVSLTASLIRVSDGAALHTAPAKWTAWAEGSPPRYDPYACASAAVDNVVALLVQQFAIVRKKIKVDPNKVLRICTEKYDGKWIEARDIKTTDEKMYIVLALPPQCDRNRFRMTIVRKDQREVLASLKLTWSRRNDPDGKGYTFDPKDVAAKGGGPGWYEVKFYSGEDPVLRRAFHIH